MARLKSSGATAGPPIGPSKMDRERERKWAAEDALRTLTRAAEIKRDPRLMADTAKLAMQQQKELAAVSKALPKPRTRKAT